MKKNLLLLILLMGVVSAQAFVLSKASNLNTINQPTIMSGVSCSTCQVNFNQCNSAGLPNNICTNTLNNCLADCTSTNPPGGYDDGPPRYDCTGLPKWSPFYCERY